MAPGNELPLYKLQQLRILLEETDWSHEAIGKEIGLHRKTVWLRHRCLELYGQFYAPQTVKLGRVSLLNTAQKRVRTVVALQALLIANSKSLSTSKTALLRT